MLTVGDKCPTFNLKAVVSADLKNAFMNVTDQCNNHHWRVVFFWPKDFTFVCPTELVEFGNLVDEFKERNALILGVSTDSEFVHHAWRVHHPDLTHLPYPMLSDIKRELSEAFGVLDKNEGVAMRATFIIDPENTIRYVAVNDLKVGRNPAEVLRVLDALQTNELTPCNWQRGDRPLKVA